MAARGVGLAIFAGLVGLAALGRRTSPADPPAGAITSIRVAQPVEKLPGETVQVDVEIENLSGVAHDYQLTYVWIRPDGSTGNSASGATNTLQPGETRVVTTVLSTHSNPGIYGLRIDLVAIVGTSVPTVDFRVIDEAVNMLTTEPAGSISSVSLSKNDEGPWQP